MNDSRSSSENREYDKEEFEPIGFDSLPESPSQFTDTGFSKPKSEAKKLRKERK